MNQKKWTNIKLCTRLPICTKSYLSAEQCTLFKTRRILTIFTLDWGQRSSLVIGSIAMVTDLPAAGPPPPRGSVLGSVGSERPLCKEQEDGYESSVISTDYRPQRNVSVRRFSLLSLLCKDVSMYRSQIKRNERQIQLFHKTIEFTECYYVCFS